MLIEPLLKKHHVQVYVNGHDHDLQHVRRGGINYIGCGAGSEVRPVKAIAGTLFGLSRSGFAAMESTADLLTVQFRVLGRRDCVEPAFAPDPRRRAMAVLREWRAEIRRELREEYVSYVRSTGLAGYRRTAGNLAAVVAVRDLDPERSEIVTLSWWKDAQSIVAFAGEDIGRARYFPEDDRYLLTRPDTVQHYDSSDPAM